MKAVALTEYLPISDERALLDVELDDPSPGPHDLLVRVQAVSVNPVDTKIRSPKPKVEESPRVLGWDAAGEVQAVGSEVKGFAVGDRVYYAGSVTRPGSNAELQLVDARIAASMPKTLDFAAAAAIPLTGITAFEVLFDRMGISEAGGDKGKTILIVGGAGGVGSLAIQLAKRVAGLDVIATASRPSSREWVLSLGADHVIDHRQPLDEELKKVVESGQVDYVLCLNSTQHHWDAMCRAVAPQGTIASIVEVSEPVNIQPLMSKSARFAWELMFTRPMFETADMARQGEILARLASMIDEGTIQATKAEVLRPIDAKTMRKAHAMLEGGHTIGKVVVEGW